jgi:hypothetical protein
MKIRRNGAVVDSRDVAGTIDIYANNVTIIRTRVHTDDYFPIRLHLGFSGLRVIDSEVAGERGCQAAVAAANFEVQRSNIHGCEDGLETDGGVTVRDSYIHDLAVTPTSHNDGIQMLSGRRVLIEHDTIIVARSSVSAVNLTADMGLIDGVTVRDSLLDGGQYSVYSRRSPGSGYPAPTGIVVTSNRFGAHQGYGLLSSDGPVAWSSNVRDATGLPAT